MGRVPDANVLQDWAQPAASIVDKGVVDAQAKGDWVSAYAKLREAAGHMQMIADPLAGAISKQFPDKFAMK